MPPVGRAIVDAGIFEAGIVEAGMIVPVVSALSAVLGAASSSFPNREPSW